MKTRTAFDYLEVLLTSPESFWNDSISYKHSIARDLIESLASIVEKHISQVLQSNCM
jgi:hypothetical protein